MNILFAIALTTGILSGIWGWVAVALGLHGDERRGLGVSDYPR